MKNYDVILGYRQLSNQILLKNWLKEAKNSIKECNLTHDSIFDGVKEQIEGILECYEFPPIFLENLNSFSKKSDKVDEKILRIFKDIKEQSGKIQIARYDLGQIQYGLEQILVKFNDKSKDVEIDELFTLIKNVNFILKNYHFEERREFKKIRSRARKMDLFVDENITQEIIQFISRLLEF